MPLYLTAACGLVDRTPRGFGSAIEDGRDVPPALLQAQLRLVRSRRVALLAVNDQTEDPVTDQVVAAARRAALPVVGFGETLPAGRTFVSMFHGELDAVAAAVRAMTPAVSFRDAALGFGDRTLWQGLTLDIAPGEFLAVLGPNGSGKTTLIKAVLGLQALRAGSLDVLGRPVAPGNRRIGYVPQQRLLDASTPLRGSDLVRFGVDGGRFGFPLPRRSSARAHGRAASTRSVPAPSPSVRPRCCPAASSSGSGSARPSPTTRRCSSATSP